MIARERFGHKFTKGRISKSIVMIILHIRKELLKGELLC